MKKIFLHFVVLLIAGISFQAQAQEPFSVSIVQRNATANMPRLHSGVIAEWDNKWIFIGGRSNGLHGFLPPSAFPFSGINNSIWVYDPINDQVWSSNMFNLPDSVRETLSSSNMQSYQNGSTLYITGGYGWSDVPQDYITFPHLVSVDLASLVTQVVAGTSVASSIKMRRDQRMAVCGGEMGKIGNTFFIAFGHRFDGVYSRNALGGFFVQHYTNQVRRFEIDNSGARPSIVNYQTDTDSVQFHRRDYNLVQQIFPNGEQGYTAFSGVFLPGIDAPFHNTIDIKAGSSAVTPSFNQYLAAYTTATMPVWDAGSSTMHTLFFGGISKYVLDLTTGNTTVDTLVPFVNTVSQITRAANGTMSETWQSVTMPELLGTNAKFVLNPSVPVTGDKIIDLNALTGNTLVGYIIGGIRSPEANISTTDPSSSEPSPYVLDVYIDKGNAIQSIPVRDPFGLHITPNPASTELTVSVVTDRVTDMEIDFCDMHGHVIETLYKGTLSIESRAFTYKVDQLPAGLYYCRVRSAKFSRTEPVLVTPISGR